MSEISKIDQNLIIKKIDNNTVNISINNNEMLMAVVGQFDQNLKNLSKLTNTEVYFRGNSITCKANNEKLSLFCEAIKFLINKYLLTNIIEKEDIVLSVKKNLELKESNVESFKQLIKTPKKSVIPRSERQKDYVRALKESDMELIARATAVVGGTIAFLRRIHHLEFLAAFAKEDTHWLGDFGFQSTLKRPRTGD